MMCENQTTVQGLLRHILLPVERIRGRQCITPLLGGAFHFHVQSPFVALPLFQLKKLSPKSQSLKVHEFLIKLNKKFMEWS